MEKMRGNALYGSPMCKVPFSGEIEIYSSSLYGATMYEKT